MSAGNAASIRSTGRSSPITPVEATNTSCGDAPNASATLVAVCSVTRYPAAPVKALALPELTIMALARPEPAAIALMHQSTGAAVHCERVKTPATALRGASSASITSSRP